ncbi:MAG: O-antigen ligase family protein [Alphaproteobacteria bacterium]|nr:O-antigen ligase family protein [Alphaproteobacteria bacterium]
MRTGLAPADFARAVFFALLPAVAVGGAMGLPVLLSLAGLAALGPSLLRQVLEKRPLVPALLVAWAAWAGATSLWSPWDGPTALKTLSLIALGLPFIAAAGANEKSSALTLSAAVAAFLVLAILLGVEAAFDMPINRGAQPGLAEGELNRNPSRGLIVLLAMTWPAVAWLIAKRRGWSATLAGVIMIAACALSLQFDQLVTAIGLGASSLVFAIALFARRFAILATSFGLALWMLIAPFVTPLIVASPQLVESVPLSWAHRIAIWRYTCARILEQPWFGHGIDSGRTTTDMLVIRGLPTRGIPVHPHSASLQVWHDLGLVGALLSAALLAYGGWRLSRAFANDRYAGAATAAVLAMLGLMANVGWSLWQEWWMATLILTAALIAALGARAARA